MNIDNRAMSQGRLGDKIESSMNVNSKTPIPSNANSPFNQINVDHLI